jgi:hypothetical protein
MRSALLSGRSFGGRASPAAVVVATLALAGSVGLLVTTRWGIGISTDSVTYVAAARNLLAGHGLVVPAGGGVPVPLTHYPPLYSLLLATFGSAGCDPLVAARWLAALVFGATILLAGHLTDRCGRSGSWTTPLASLLVLLSVPLLHVSTMAWTEPLFILCGLGGLWFLSGYLAGGRTDALLLASSLLACAFLTRYAGLALIVTAALGILAFGPGPRLRRARASLAVLTIGGTPTALWMGRNVLVAGTATHRAFHLHPPGLPQAAQLLMTVADWTLPEALPATLRMALASALLLLAVLAATRVLRAPGPALGPETGTDADGPRATAFLRLLVTFVATYAAALLAALSLFDAALPLDNRILAPAHAGALVAIPILVHRMPRLRRGDGAPTREPLRIGRALGVALLGFHLLQGTLWLARAQKDGRGFAGRAWRDSAVVEALRRLPRGTRVYTNSFEAVYILTDREAESLPARIDPLTSRANPEFPAQIEAMRRGLEAGGVLAYFARVRGRWFLPDLREIRERIPLRLDLESEDGVIGRLDRSAGRKDGAIRSAARSTGPPRRCSRIPLLHGRPG